MPYITPNIISEYQGDNHHKGYVVSCQKAAYACNTLQEAWDLYYVLVEKEKAYGVKNPEVEIHNLLWKNNCELRKRL